VSDLAPTPDEPDAAGTGIDTTVSHSARIWDYWLKGKDNYLALNHPTLEVTGEKMATAIRYWNEYGTPPGTHRTPGELARFFDGMDLVEPGVVSITRWRPEATTSGEPEEIDQFGGVGRKP
jgi:S-adenosyl methyltransferase